MSETVLDPRGSGELIAKLSTAVTIEKEGIASLAERVVTELNDNPNVTNNYNKSELHPRQTDSWAADWICLKNAISFCYWSEKVTDSETGWTIEYKKRRYKGYFSLCAAICKAKDSGKWGDITNPAIYSALTLDDLTEIFEGVKGTVRLGFLEERLKNLKEVGSVLTEKYNGSFGNLIKSCNGSATELLNIIVKEFPCFRDEATYKEHKVSFHARAISLISDIWRCFKGEGLGAFDDIDKITIPAECRIPQALNYFGVLKYSDSLMLQIRQGTELEYGGEAEVEIRGCTVHAIELLCAEVHKVIEKAQKHHDVNPLLLDNILLELRRKENHLISKRRIREHKTKCTFY